MHIIRIFRINTGFELLDQKFPSPQHRPTAIAELYALRDSKMLEHTQIVDAIMKVPNSLNE